MTIMQKVKSFWTAPQPVPASVRRSVPGLSIELQANAATAEQDGDYWKNRALRAESSSDGWYATATMQAVALDAIVRMETPGANATVKRMAARARLALGEQD